MPELNFLGRTLIITGLIFLVAGGLLLWGEKGSGLGWLGRLPGDILIERRNFRFYFPITTGLILSIVLSVILWLIGRR